MKRFAILLTASVVVTAIAVVLAGMGAGACHCSTPPRILFPYSMLLENASEAFSSWAFLGQFPAYAIVLALARSRRASSAASLILVALHGAAVYAALSFATHR